MSLDRVFPNPLVKTVVFQITFPSLFFLEKKIGDFQIKIMKQFPTSHLLIQRQLLIMVGGQEDPSKLPNGMKPEETKRVWQFLSPEGVQLDVTLDSLSLQSNAHKSYCNGDGPHFRDTIASVCDSFIAVTDLPTITRVGLRYIDKGPIPNNTNETFLSYYNSAFPLSRFSLDKTIEMHCRVAVKRDSHSLRYTETLQIEGDKKTLILDFDAWSENVDPSQIMVVTDSLHQATSDEFEKTIKQPVIDYMSTTQEVSDVKRS